MKKQAGFTFLEVLIAFLIFLVIASLTPQFFKLISFQPKLLQRAETGIFFQQLAIDVHHSANVEVVNNIVYLQQGNDKTVTYAYFHNRIRRQVNNTGQEIVLQKVAVVQFTQWKNGIDVSVTDIYNQRHESRVTHLLSLDDLSYD
ncbi:competence type IV pilus minor pilin ComGF [Bacillaceae bacterium IKA-2]|nr:competence type IV pilus minor pilin ComGF [Bacillaceae bacterium IKA-2]